MLREAVLIRSVKDLKLAPETSNPYRGCLGSLFGNYFAVTDGVSPKKTVYLQKKKELEELGS